MRRFYKYTLCIIENFRLTNPHLHHGLLKPLLQSAAKARNLLHRGGFCIRIPPKERSASEFVHAFDRYDCSDIGRQRDKFSF
jgi:hypothetical protein